MKLRLFCEGEPVHSTFALASGDFRYAGELMASSIVQGGPAPNFFARWVYLYITGGLDKVEPCVDHIKDKNLKDIVEKVCTIYVTYLASFYFIQLIELYTVYTLYGISPGG
jgi:hypothetical protein